MSCVQSRVLLKNRNPKKLKAHSIIEVNWAHIHTSYINTIIQYDYSSLFNLSIRGKPETERKTLSETQDAHFRCAYYVNLISLIMTHVVCHVTCTASRRFR